jgi:hypothetical protein
VPGPAHEDDLLGAEPLGRKDGEQTDRAVTDDGHAGADVDAAPDRGVVTGAQHVGQGQQRRDERGVGGDRELDQRAVGQGYAGRFDLAALAGQHVPETAVLAEGVQPLAAEDAGAVGVCPR